MQQLLIELQYLGSIAYYKKLKEFQQVVIEKHENFVKSSYRNRCYICGPNGKLRLSIPLQKGKHQRAKYTDVKIDYDYDWQRIHWNSLCSAYRRSPYFEFYEDRFEPFYRNRFEDLFDFNLQLTKLLIELLEMEVTMDFSTQYKKELDEETADWRSRIIPQKTWIVNDAPKYHQVFEDRVGFFKNMSVVDLLFNEGPHSKDFL